jgi:hypothetical protein
VNQTNNKDHAILRSMLIAGAAAVFSAADPAAAAPDRLHVVQTVTIAAPTAVVWGIIQNFSDLTWHPAIKSSSATNGNIVGSVRTLDLGGPHLVEELAKYAAARMSYSYRITADPANVKTVPVTKYYSTITVTASGTGSLVTWKGSFLRADPSETPAADGNDETAVKAITGIYRGGLDALKTRAESKG